MNQATSQFFGGMGGITCNKLLQLLINPNFYAFSQIMFFSVMQLHGKQTHYKLYKEVKDAGFGIKPDKLASIVESHDTNGLELHGGIQGLARELSVSLDDAWCLF